MADQYDPNAIHNRGKQRINGSLTVTGAAEFGEVPTVNGQKLKTAEIFTDVIHITDTEPFEKIYDVAGKVFTSASIDIKSGALCYVKPVLKQKHEDDADFEDMANKFSSYYTDTTTTNRTIQNAFTKEKLKLSVTFEGDKNARIHYPSILTPNSNFYSGLKNILDSCTILLKCTKGGNNKNGVTRYSQNLVYQQQTENSYCGIASISGTVPTGMKGIYRLHVNIVNHIIDSTRNEIYFNYFIMDEENNEVVETSHPNCFVDLKSSDPSFPLASDVNGLFYGLYISFVYDEELGELTGLEGNQNHFNSGDTLISSEIIGYPVFTYSVDDGEETQFEPVALNPNVYPFGNSAYFWIRQPPENQAYFNKGETYTMTIDPATVDAIITFKAF